MWLSNNQRTFRKTILVFSTVFILFLITHYSIAQIRRVDSIPIAVEFIILFTFIVWFFYLTFKENVEIFLSENANFWIIAGILLYLGTTFFFNILANTLSDESFKQFYEYSFLGDILKNILIAIGIYIMSRPNSNRSNKSISKVPYLDMN